jgi:DNA mismatch repair protein MutL
MPETAGRADPAELLRELAAQELPASEPAERVRRLAATVACQAAVKAGQPLSHERLRWIADELFLTPTPTTCPHGRVAVLRLSDRDVDQRFGRTWGGGAPP